MTKQLIKNQILFDIHAYHNFADFGKLKRKSIEYLLCFLPKYEREHYCKILKIELRANKFFKPICGGAAR